MAMLRDGRIDGIVRFLEGRHRQWADFVEDAVFESIVKLLATAERRDVENPTAFITRVAERQLLRAIGRARGQQAEIDELESEDAEHDVVEVRATVRMLKATMAGWTESVRVVTVLVLDALAADEPLSSGDLARDASAILGRTVTADECRTWKSRGLERLRETLKERQQ